MPSITFAPKSSETLSKKINILSRGNSIMVIGAGAFGGWTALNLVRRNFNVTLIDAWGPGNSRSSSGDETRVIRSTYGANEFYFNLNVRALELWKEHELRWKKKLFQNKGVLWMCYDKNAQEVEDSISFADKHNMPYEKLSIADMAARYPIVNTGDLSHAYFDSYGGCLRAREACQAVQKAFIEEGGTYLQSHVHPGKIESGQLTDVLLSNGRSAKAHAYIFACGSWLNTIFPDVLGNVITCTKQEVYYLGVPRENPEAYEKFPVWVDVDGADFYYGIPGNSYRGFKIGVDKRGEAFDPTHGDRTPNPEVLARARKFITHRFPGLKNAPVIENRVCPYENSPDGNFLFDHHPEAENLFFLGGGSGHGFKHGPALGELVATCIGGESGIPAQFRLK